MVHCWIVLAIFLPMVFDVKASVNNSTVTTESLVGKYGYPFEAHTVTTSDGYILTLHRIPYSSQVPSNGPRPVVFLMHCLLCSSSDWLDLGPERGLGFLLADAGFDIWLGNARGNTYSRKHVSLDPKSEKFWDFSYHEIGITDLPTMIDYVRAKTAVEKIVYIGHSQGTTTFLLLNSLKPEFSKYIESAHLLSPVAFNSHSPSVFMKYSSLFGGHPTLGVPLDILGSFEFNPNKWFMEMVAALLCDKDRPNYILCTNPLFLLAEFNEDTVDSSILDDVMKTTPAGASTKQLLHYLQTYSSGHFRHFDYGLARNLIRYRSIAPPNYPLNKIDAPIYLYYSDNDALAPLEDVQKLIEQLKTLVKAHRVADKNFDHMSQLYSAKSKAQVYDFLLENILNNNATDTNSN